MSQLVLVHTMLPLFAWRSRAHKEQSTMKISIYQEFVTGRKKHKDSRDSNMFRPKILLEIEMKISKTRLKDLHIFFNNNQVKFGRCSS